MSRNAKMMVNIFRWILAIIACILLIGSFPAREYISTTACDVMRLFGFGCIFCHIIIGVVVGKKDVE